MTKKEFPDLSEFQRILSVFCNVLCFFFVVVVVVVVEKCASPEISTKTVPSWTETPVQGFSILPARRRWTTPGGSVMYCDLWCWKQAVHARNTLKTIGPPKT